ncbi:MAG: exosortase/archaeosortase family protein [Dysgonamonadaceae bacterium]|jgi:exosortase/archaeosortase family protein|nr:exosortase/archaeosortase family protein [Dysgonamonadaceae bacterium]
MNARITKLQTILAPYTGILTFLCLLFFFWFGWESLVDGELGFIRFPWIIESEHDRDLYLFFLGKDVTPAWARDFCIWLTNVAAWFVHLFPNQDDLIVDGILIAYPVNLPWKLSIVVGCTGVKQMSIFVLIMLFYRCWSLKKYQWHKLWYIPAGCLILTIYNIIRIGSTTMLTKGHPERFDSLHDGIFRYIYYTIVFLLWVIWEERFAKRNEKN